MITNELRENLNNLNLTTPVASTEQRHQIALERRLGLIRTLAFALVVLILLSIISSLGRILQGNTTSILISGISLSVGIICLFCYFITGQGATLSQARLASYLLTFSVLIAVTGSQFLPDIDYALEAAFILVPILAAIVGLRRNETISISVLAGLLLTTTVIFRKLNDNIPDNNYLNITTPLSNWLAIYSVTAVGIVIFTRRTDRATELAEEQTDRLSRLLTALNTTTTSGFSLSHELSGVTTELDIASHQQATGTQEQVAAITQVTSSLEELNESANRIALNAKAVVESANQAVATATEVKNASQLSQTTASKGYEAVEQAINSVQRMRDNIEQMASRLLRLTEQTNNVGKIVDLINGIAEETHLLSLNASIEAAGSLDGQGRGGERFGVIALEVKNLADRSKDATKEIRETIAEMQNAVAAAVLTAEEGRKETFAAVGRSQLSGEVIHTLTEVISDSYRQADQILEAAQRVKTRCEEISLATNQQRSANQQILATMREIGRISQENAGSVSQLAGMAVRVNNQVEQLNTVLQKSNQSMQLIGAA